MASNPVPPTPPPAPASDLSLATLEATLARYGIALPASRAVATAAEAEVAAVAIGFPVALKIRSPDILHKTEAGGVMLDLRSGAEVKEAAGALLAAARAAHRLRVPARDRCRHSGARGGSVVRRMRRPRNARGRRACPASRRRGRQCR